MIAARPHGRPRERGVALLLVLWVFMILGVMALDFGRYMRDDAAAAVNFADETQGYYVAVGGMMRALWLAQQDREQAANPQADPIASRKPGKQATPEELPGDPLPVDGEWHAGTLASSHYEVRLTDQGGLVSLNKGSDVLLTRLVSGVLLGSNHAVKGQDKRTADNVATIVDRILDYRDPDHLKRTHGLEAEGGYRAKNAYFDAPEELLRIPGVTGDVLFGVEGRPGLKKLVSVHNRADTINLRTASVELLAILLGKDPQGMASLQELRGTDRAAFVVQVQAEAQGVDPELASHLVDEAPKIVLVEGRADTSRERGRASVAAIVAIGGDDAEGVRILQWFDRAPWDGVLPTLSGADGLPS